MTGTSKVAGPNGAMKRLGPYWGHRDSLGNPSPNPTGTPCESEIVKWCMTNCAPQVTLGPKTTRGGCGREQLGHGPPNADHGAIAPKDKAGHLEKPTCVGFCKCPKSSSGPHSVEPRARSERALSRSEKVVFWPERTP